jgi:hypothetical protein
MKKYFSFFSKKKYLDVKENLDAEDIENCKRKV